MKSNIETCISLVEGCKLQSGKYIIKRVLGQGGFGITYLAEHTMLDIQVAIKEFFPKSFCDREEDTNNITLGTSGNRDLVDRFKAKFIKEARNIAKLKHPGIVRIQDVFEENNTAYYVMDYIEGHSLSGIFEECDRLSIPKATEWIKKIGDALSYIHSKNINHLDVKPANIMLDERDNPILIDFGLAKQYDTAGEETSTTPVGISHGYAPPEQYRKGGVSSFSPQADIYSLGATYYKLITGITPPEAMELLDSELIFPSFIDPKTIKAITSAMSVSKQSRPCSVDAFLTLLDNDECTRLVSQNIKDRSEPSLKPQVKEDVTISSDNIGTVITIKGVQFKMTNVKGGTLHMEERKGFLASLFDQPSQDVELSDYEIGQTTVTQSLWNAVMGSESNPSSYSGADHPVDSINYYEAIKFIKKLNELTGLSFSLPTEAQWEYAAKGGSKSRGYLYSGSNEVKDVAWINSSEGTYPVAQKKPNELGIYDMSGNVEEWCYDWYREYNHTFKKDYAGPKAGEKKILRGGSFCHSKSVAEVSYRQSANPGLKDAKIGFRLARKL